MNTLRFIKTVTELGNAIIEKSQANCTLQDLGRHGYRHLGISPSGAADVSAFLWSNRLINNAPETPALEIIMGNFSVRFTEATRICVTGASATLTLNQQEIPLWSAVDVDIGDTLNISFPQSGIYNYLAIKDGFAIEPVLDSNATYLRDGFGKSVAARDHLPYPAQQTHDLGPRAACPWNLIPDFGTPLALRFIPDDAFFSMPAEDQHCFLSTSYSIDPQSNKMGARLTGHALTSKTTRRYSRAVCHGTIQLPSSGQPIVLLADHQTIGGYPTLGTVYSSDGYQLAQKRPGQAVRFVKGSLEEAQESRRKFLSELMPTFSLRA